MKTTEYIYPEVNEQEIEIELWLDVFENGEYEILDVYEEDHDNLTRSELRDIAHDYIHHDWIQEVVRMENEKRFQSSQEDKLEQMRINQVDKL